MPTASHWTTFLVASFLFIQVPGPSLLFTLGRALTVGRRDALLSVLGNALGLVGQVAAVAIGLGPLVASSATAYTVLKLAGAAYVVYLGVQAIRHRADARLSLDVPVDERPTTALASVRAGLMVGLSNPKTVVFFAAFLPQFINASAPAAPQLLALGLVFASMAVCSDGAWALLAARARTWFAHKPTRLDAMGVTGGVMMVTLGGVLAVAD